MAEKKTGLPVDPTSSLVSQIAAPFIPVEYETVRPYEVRSSQIDDMGGYTAYREIPGEYKITGFGTPPIVSGGIEFFKQFIDDPAETAGGIASAVGEELKEYPARQLRTALAGGETFNPETGEVERFDPFGAPATVGAGTAVSIARTASKDGGGPVLGIMAGRMAKDGPSIFSQARASKSGGKSRQEIFDLHRAYFDDAVLGQDSDAFRFEIPTANSKFKEDGPVQFMNVEYGRGLAIGLTDDFRSVQFTKDGDLVNYNRKSAAKLSDILDFPELYEQYPDFKDVAIVKLIPEEGELPFGGPSAFFAGRAESPLGVPTIGLKESQSRTELQSALLHEIQHLVQTKEGLPGGASGQYIMELLDEELGGGVDKNFLKSVALPAYESVYGEAEARVVQRRFERPEEAKLDPVTTRQKEAPEGDISMTEYEAVENAANMVRELLEDGYYEYKDVYPDAFKAAAPKSTGLLGGDKPQRFYHGTNAAYKEFDPDAPYTFVADKPGTAEYYAGDALDGTPNIRPVYLKDVNFFDVDNPDHLQQLLESDWYAQYGKSLDDKFFDHDDDMNFLDLVEAGDYGTIEDSGLVDWIKSQGFDGFTTYEQDGKNYGVFNVKNIVPGVAKKKDGGIVTLADVARNTGRGPMGVASLSSTARNMNRPMVS